MKKYFYVLLLLGLGGCKDSELRGYVEKSKDGKTYMVIEDDNGGHCGPMSLNGNEWPHEIGMPGQVEPGEHTLECGTAISFLVKEGTIFHVDYWGP